MKQTPWILVVDDDPGILEFVQDLLKPTYMVDTAKNVKEAQARLQNGAYDLVLTDMVMPEIAGMELVKYVRLHHPDIPVIVFTGYANFQDAVSAIKLGGFDYLPKPLDRISDLSLAVERASEYRRIRLEREQLLAQVTAERERLRSVIAHAGDAILAADAEGVVIAGNPAACHLLGQETLVGLDAWTRLPPPLAVLSSFPRASTGPSPK